MRNKKIANLTFKEPYSLLSKIEDKSDFLSVRRGRDSNPRLPFDNTAFRERYLQPLETPLHVNKQITRNKKTKCLIYLV